MWKFLGRSSSSYIILFYFLFSLFIFQEEEEYLVAWRVSPVQETLEKPGYRPCLVWSEREFSKV